MNNITATFLRIRKRTLGLLCVALAVAGDFN